MSGAVTYGPDGGGANNGAEYSAYVANGGARPTSGYAAQLGQSQGGMMPQGMVPQQMPMSGAGINQGFLPPTMGGPSMRESVEGIPQVHMQQQQQQQQHQQQQQQQQHLAGGVPGMPHLATSAMPQYALQSGMTMAGHQYAAAGVPMQYYQVAHPGAQGYAQMVPNYQFGSAPQFMHAAGEWGDEYDEGSGAVLYGNLEVKHRRRTTPEQLRVLEHWFEISPRPDNTLREWLAAELGITKRNVQVWFQNRRAKIKQQEKAREAAAAESKKDQAAMSESGAEGAASSSQTGGATPNADVTTPPPASVSSAQGTPIATPAQPPQPPSLHCTPPVPSVATPSVPARPTSSQKIHHPMGNLLPASAKMDMGRRVSIAGGDISSIEEWAIKRRQQMGQTSPYASATLSPANSPMGMAAAARRNSQPYPTQIITHHVPEDAAARSALGSPKVSPSSGPNGRTPGHLLFTAMRNNTIRRASMPGGAAQLISTTAFTPPRVSTYHNSNSESPSGRHGAPRELSPIKDQDYEIDPALRQVPMTFVTPPPQNGMSNGPSSGLFNDPSSADHSLAYSLNPGLPFAPNSPLPNPTFSFGGTPGGNANAVPNMFGSSDKVNPSGQLLSDHDPNHALFMALERGRLASIASVNSVATNEGSATEYGSDTDWGSFIPPGFDPDIRRASAPADLLHNIGLLGISGPPSQNPSSIRPSPLAAGFPQSAVDQNGSHTYELTVPSIPIPGPLSAPIQSSSSMTLGGGPYIPAAKASPTHSASGGSALASEGPSPAGTHTQMHAQGFMMPPPMVPGQQHQQQSYQFPGMHQQHQQQHQQHQYAESSAALPPSFPSVPDPSAYMNSSGFPSSSGSSSGETMGTSNEYDLSFEFSTDSDDKEQFTFLSNLSNNDNGGSDTVNVLV